MHVSRAYLILDEGSSAVLELVYGELIHECTEAAVDPVNMHPLKTSPTNMIISTKPPEITKADGITYGCTAEKVYK